LLLCKTGGEDVEIKRGVERGKERKSHHWQKYESEEEERKEKEGKEGEERHYTEVYGQ